MRKIAHRLLTGLPALTVALGSLWAAASPSEANKAYIAFVELMQQQYMLLLAIAMVAIYFAAWWLTAVEPKTRRQMIVEGLRSFHEAMWSAQNQLQTADWEELDQVIAASDKITQDTADWIMQNMSQAAWTAFARPQLSAGIIIYKNAPAGAETEQRSNATLMSQARLAVLDKFLESGAYDGGASKAKDRQAVSKPKKEPPATREGD